MLGLTLMNPKTVSASDFAHVTATAYCPTGNLTYMETVPRVGVAAGKKEWLGKTAYCWLDDGSGEIKPENFYSVLSFEDLAGSEAIKKGYVIDVFLDSYDEAIQFGAKKMIIQIVESVG